MDKFDETVKVIKKNIKDLEKFLASKVDELDDDKKQKAFDLFDKVKTTINNSIEKVGNVIDDVKDEEKLNQILDLVKAKAKEAVDFATEKINALVNNEDDKSDLDNLRDEILADYEKIKGSDIYKKTTVLIQEGYAKINEYLEKPEVKKTINNAKKTTIQLAEKGVAGLKKVLAVEEEPKKVTKKTTKKATAKKATTKKAKTTGTKKTTKKAAK